MSKPLFGLLLGMFFVAPLLSFAQSSIIVNGLISELQNVQVNQNTIDGKILFVRDASTHAFNNVFLTILLSEETRETKSVINGVPTTVVEPGALILAKTENDFFTLFPRSKLARDFSLDYPAGIPTGTYRLEVRVTTISGDIVTAAFQNINITGGGEFLKIDQATCKLMLAGMTFGPNDGPNLFPGENPKISCKVSNPTPLQIEAIPVVSLATYFAYGFPQTDLKEIKLDKIIFGPKESKTVTFEIPSPKDPQVYQIGLQFHNAVSGQINSPISFFRWVVKGAAARIHNVALNHSKYKEGSRAKVSVSVFVSPDLYWNTRQDLLFVKADPTRFSGTPIAEPIFKATLMSGSGKICGQGETKSKVPFTTDGIKVRHIIVPITQDCVDPKAEISFFDGENLLAGVDYSTISRSVSRSGGMSTKVIYFLVAIIAAALAWIVYNKIKNEP